MAFVLDEQAVDYYKNNAKEIFQRYDIKRPGSNPELLFNIQILAEKYKNVNQIENKKLDKYKNLRTKADHNKYIFRCA